MSSETASENEDVARCRVRQDSGSGVISLRWPGWRRSVGVGGAGSVMAACGSSWTRRHRRRGAVAAPQVGSVAPLTGPLAAFGEADTFCVQQWEEFVKDGLACGDGQTHPIEFIMKDSQSDSNRAATVAGDLMTNGIDVVMVRLTDAVRPRRRPGPRPSASPACPTTAPGRRLLTPRPTNPCTSTYRFWLRHDHQLRLHVGQARARRRDRREWPNDADGAASADPRTPGAPLLAAPAPPSSTAASYPEAQRPSRRRSASSESARLDIMSSVMVRDSANFWRQIVAAGFKPRRGFIGGASVPSALEALSDIGYGLATDAGGRDHPFKSSLTGKTCQRWPTP